MIKTIFFFDTVNAIAGKTLSSALIPFPFRVLRVSASFPAGCVRQVQHKIIASLETSDATSRPSGENVLGTGGLSQVGDPSIRGENETLSVDHIAEFPESYFLLCFTQNDDTAAHTIDVKVEIQDLRPALQLVEGSGLENA